MSRRYGYRSYSSFCIRTFIRPFVLTISSPLSIILVLMSTTIVIEFLLTYYTISFISFSTYFITLLGHVLILDKKIF